MSLLHDYTVYFLCVWLRTISRFKCNIIIILSFVLSQVFSLPRWPPFTTIPTQATAVDITVNLMKNLNIFSFLSAMRWFFLLAWHWMLQRCMWLCSARSAGSPPLSTCSTCRCVTLSTSWHCPSSSITTQTRTTGPSVNHSARSYASCSIPTYMVGNSLG